MDRKTRTTLTQHMISSCLTQDSSGSLHQITMTGLARISSNGIDIHDSFKARWTYCHKYSAIDLIIHPSAGVHTPLVIVIERAANVASQQTRSLNQTRLLEDVLRMRAKILSVHRSPFVQNVTNLQAPRIKSRLRPESQLLKVKRRLISAILFLRRHNVLTSSLNLLR